MGPHVDLLKRKEVMTEEERRTTEQRKGRKKEADEWGRERRTKRKVGEANEPKARGEENEKS
jgi:hypothetical protein